MGTARRSYLTEYRKFLEKPMKASEVKMIAGFHKGLRNEDIAQLWIRQEIGLRKHNAKRVAMEQFDRRYRAYVILCNFVSAMGIRSPDQLTAFTNNWEEFTKTLLEFGKVYQANNPKSKKPTKMTLKGESTTTLKKVTEKLERRNSENNEDMTSHFKWAYETYSKMKDDRRRKKYNSCLASYSGRCGICSNGKKVGESLPLLATREDGICYCAEKIEETSDVYKVRYIDDAKNKSANIVGVTEAVAKGNVKLMNCEHCGNTRLEKYTNYKHFLRPVQHGVADDANDDEKTAEADTQVKSSVSDGAKLLPRQWYWCNEKKKGEMTPYLKKENDDLNAWHDRKLPCTIRGGQFKVHKFTKHDAKRYTDYEEGDIVQIGQRGGGTGFLRLVVAPSEEPQVKAAPEPRTVTGTRRLLDSLMTEIEENDMPTAAPVVKDFN